MGLLIYPLIQGQEAGWPLWTYLMMAASVAAFAALALRNRGQLRRGRDPLIVTSVFRHRAFSAGLASITAFFAGMIGLMLALTLFLQFGEHFSAIHAGLTLAPWAFGMAAGATVAAAVLVPRIGRTALQLGAVVVAGGTIWLYLVISANGLHTSSLDLIAPLLALGLGIGMLVSPLFGFILASVTDEETGSASGVLNALQQLAGAIGVAVLGTVFFAALSHGGFVTALQRCLLIELAIAPVLALLTFALPRHPRDEAELLAAGSEPATEAVPELLTLTATPR
jgi:MFS family permease